MPGDSAGRPPGAPAHVSDPEIQILRKEVDQLRQDIAAIQRELKRGREDAARRAAGEV
jgi:hypothetical protein